MKQGVYIVFGTNGIFLGVEKKIRNQIKAFSQFFQMNKIVVNKKNGSLLQKIAWRLPGGAWGLEYDNAFEEISNIALEKESPCFFYIRTIPIDIGYLHFLKSIREAYPRARIIVELPTYPYGKEILSNATMWPWFFKDRFNRRSIAQYVDRIVLFNDTRTVFGIPAIKAMNGIDVSEVKPIISSNDDPNTIRLIVVAMMQPYHGYERIIKGLSRYYKKGGTRNIEIIMVGYGGESEYYRRLSRDMNIEDKIVFKGRLEGVELDEAYERCDIAVGSLGGYKIGVKRFASIKLGEYLAKGLPVITGAKTYLFEDSGREYNLDFPNDSSEIDIDAVVAFYDSIYAGKEKREVRETIRQFARDNIDISLSMKNVIDYLNEEKP